MLRDHRTVRQAIEAELGFDLGNPAGVAQLLMASAVKANSRGIVLFSTSKLDHVQQCVEAAKIGRSPDNHDRLNECLRLVESVRSQNMVR